VAGGAPARMAPRAGAHDSSAPVFRSSILRHSSSETIGRTSKAMSSAWPAVIACVARANSNAASAA